MKIKEPISDIFDIFFPPDEDSTSYIPFWKKALTLALILTVLIFAACLGL